jgi:endonuclease YncB( thermonuclease family)
MRGLLALALILMAASSPLGQAAASEVKHGDLLEGRAVALGGESLMLVGTAGTLYRVRLWGVEAPGIGGPPDYYARAAIDDLLAPAAGQATCSVVGKDTRGRVVATCHSGGSDLAQGLLAQGRALTHRPHIVRDSSRAELAETYLRLEREARAARKGLWADWTGQ